MTLLSLGLQFLLLLACVHEQAVATSRLTSATAASPTMPRALTCGAGSPSAKASFCDRTKGFAERASLLAAELTLDEQLNIWAFSGSTDPVPRLNLKGSSSKGQTCIHGLAPGAVFPGGAGAVASPNLTVTGHAINLGSTFDTGLVAAVSNLTRIELRAMTQLQYRLSNGTFVANSICSGGPLANSAHDPRWGRVAETYGECPYLISRIGTTATRSLQQAVPVEGGRDVHLASAQTTRHFMGYHGSNQMPTETNCTAEEHGFPVWQCGTHMTLSPRDLVDQYLPAYESCMRGSGDAWTGDPGGRAEGIMCAYSDLALTNDTAQRVPSCANEYLLKDVLRDQFQSPSLVQSAIAATACLISTSGTIFPRASRMRSLSRRRLARRSSLAGT